MLIGLHGIIESGKDAVASHLSSKYGFRVLRFAGALKLEVATRLRATCKEITIADELAGSLPNLPIALQLPQSQPNIEEWWDRRLDYVMNVERSPIMRRLLQEYGTEVRRRDDTDYWIKQWSNDYAQLMKQSFNVVVSDTRFINEAFTIRRFNGKLVKILRQNQTAKYNDHASEHGLDAWESWDRVLMNDGSLDDLFKLVDHMMGGWHGAPP